jgi:hypothetical protein
MGRFRAASLLLAALAAGLLLAACGSNGNGELLPGTTADQINSNLDLVRASVEEGNCEEAEDAVAEVSTEIDGLDKVNAKLKSALKEGAAKLSEVVSTCNAEEEAEEQKAAEAEAEEQEALESQEEAAEEEAFDKEQKAEEREEKAEEKAEQPGPPEEGEESGPNGKAKGDEEETVEPPSEEEVTPSEGGAPAGGIGPGAAVEGSR